MGYVYCVYRTVTTENYFELILVKVVAECGMHLYSV